MVDGTFLWPVRGRVLEGFGTGQDGTHNDGINIAASRGAAIEATEGGVVAYSGNELRGYGNLILVKHPNGWISAYAHCDLILVKTGQKVVRGQVIARVGASGNVSEPQLHFELRRDKKPVDPREYLPPLSTAATKEGRPELTERRAQVSGLPRRPARSWMNCQATRPERDPRVIDHSFASAFSLIGRQIETVTLRIAAHDRLIGVLVDIVKAEPKPEPIRKRYLLFNRLGRVDCRRAFVVDHFARH